MTTLLHFLCWCPQSSDSIVEVALSPNDTLKMLRYRVAGLYAVPPHKSSIIVHDGKYGDYVITTARLNMKVSELPSGHNKVLLIRNVVLDPVKTRNNGWM